MASSSSSLSASTDGRSGGGIERQRDARGIELRPGDVGDAREQRLHRRRPSRVRPPRVIEHRAHDRRDLADLLLHDRQPPGRAGIDRGVLLEHLHVARDQVERRSDLMSDARGHLSDGRHLLGAAQRLSQREHALIGIHELLVAHPQLGRRIVHPLLQRIVEVLQTGEHVVQSGGDVANFVGPHDSTRAPRSRRRRRAAWRRGCARWADESTLARTSRSPASGAGRRSA